MTHRKLINMKPSVWKLDVTFYLYIIDTHKRKQLQPAKWLRRENNSIKVDCNELVLDWTQQIRSVPTDHNIGLEKTKHKSVNRWDIVGHHYRACVSPVLFIFHSYCQTTQHQHKSYYHSTNKNTSEIKALDSPKPT